MLHPCQQPLPMSRSGRTRAPGDARDPCADGDAPQDGAGIPDGFQRLWMPHRMAYIKGEGKPRKPARRRLPVLPDTEAHRRRRPHRRPRHLVYTVLNLYPYNAGHLMVVPYRHVADYTELDGRRPRNWPATPSSR